MSFGLALGGGGSRGAAHVGVLMALEENHLLPTSISGTSSGSMVAGLYASGLTTKELVGVVEELARNGKDYLDINCGGVIKAVPELFIKKQLSLKGLIKGNKLEELMATLTRGQVFRQLNMLTMIPAVDLYSEKTVVFTNCRHCRVSEKYQWYHQESVHRAIRASISFPGVFIPVPVNQWVLVDGGVKSNIPVELLLSGGEPNVLAVDVSSDEDFPKKYNLIDVSFRSVAIMGQHLSDVVSKGYRYLLKPPLPEDAGLFSFDKMPQCMDIGYRYTMSKMPEIRHALENSSEAAGW